MKSTDRILDTIKREGSVSAKALADQLGMTTMGVRQHLQSLERDDLVDFEDHRAKIGRPTRHWSLTANGHRRFADSHNDLSVTLIDSVQEVFGDHGVAKVIAQREAATFAQYQAALKDCDNLEAKLQTLTYLRESEGYMAELHRDGADYILIEHHCPICHAAKTCPALCRSEIQLFQHLLGDHYRIEREEHIVSGQHRCTYRIGEKT
ncbi:metalloregulator ArsR/SmtB family transcription factor [Salinivibrio sp. ES.052]|uniref:helix-turn-helix transcriptional regulator n=1 Tax=Salinivibrio sp. ES.052 TaxID=1882823 RepID=UPI000928489D|nr:metalloregulator ArsR/SmtB family transcription factor [Salinivibrio sp. ES.052]SIO18823.1 Predicted transcriptional regulator, ArsR family [Salinivibrio sp. ES.052]